MGAPLPASRSLSPAAARSPALGAADSPGSAAAPPPLPPSRGIIALSPPSAPGSVPVAAVSLADVEGGEAAGAAAAALEPPPPPPPAPPARRPQPAGRAAPSPARAAADAPPARSRAASPLTIALERSGVPTAAPLHAVPKGPWRSPSPHRGAVALHEKLERVAQAVLAARAAVTSAAVAVDGSAPTVPATVDLAVTERAVASALGVRGDWLAPLASKPLAGQGSAVLSALLERERAAAEEAEAAEAAARENFSPFNIAAMLQGASIQLADGGAARVGASDEAADAFGFHGAPAEETTARV
jgi:hypothetical protein